MNRFTTTLATTLLIAAATPALAEFTASPEPQRVEITTSRSASDAAQAVQAVQAVRGLDAVYELSNGRRLAVTSYGELLRVRYARRGAVHLEHDGQGNFVSADGRLSLHFGFDSVGQPERVSLSMPKSWQ